ncbi:hydroxyacid dehydrogenase [Actinomadura gamaensis]|uniref:hydroxyacid dehydrogenase n=1 Tax=Actinomadura gamaensis TaxID=1763541 RepID=UPI003671367D
MSVECSEGDPLTEGERVEFVRPRVVLAMAPNVWPQVFDASVRERLARVAEVDLGRVVADFEDPAHADALAAAEVLLTCWGCPPLTAEVLERMPGLRAVVHAAGTVKHHVTEACWERGISVSSAAAANALPVAEFTLAAILFAGKRVLPIAARYRRERSRPEWVEPDANWGNYGLTVGIIGASLIGRRVIELLRPFDVEVLVFDPYLGEDEARKLGVRRAELSELAAASDVVTVHAPQIPETHHMIDRHVLRLMRDGATLINTARGSLVDTDALTDELVAGRLHAVLDVTEPEVLPASSPLYDLPNVLLTPHIAGSLGNELTRMAGSALDELERFARGMPFDHPVRAEALARSA